MTTSSMFVMECDEEEPEDVKPDVASLDVRKEEGGVVPTSDGNLAKEEYVESKHLANTNVDKPIGTVTPFSTPLLQDDQIKQEMPLMYECEYCFVLMVSEEALDDHKQEHWGQETEQSLDSASTEGLEDYVVVKDVKDDDYIPASDSDNDEEYQPKRRAPDQKVIRRRKRSCTQRKHSENGSGSSDWKTERVKCAMRTVNGVVEFPCGTCGKVYDAPQKLRRHLPVHETPLKTNQCGVCKKIFKTAEALDFHQPVHSEMGPYCILCGNHYTCTSTLARHVREVHSEKKLSCNVCFMTFANEKNLEKHKSQHSDPSSPHSCDVCGNRFSQKKLLMLHGRLHRDPDKKRKKAEVSSGVNLPKKARKKKGEPKVEDAELSSELVDGNFGDGLLTPEELKQGGGSTGDYPADRTEQKQRLQCDSCDYSCTLPYLLKRHKLIHSDEKPYMCSTCGKSFRHLCALTNHERVHTGERPYECPECGLRCKTVGNLIKHRGTHTGSNKSHACDLCDRSFSNGMPLRHHMERDHGVEMPHKCDVCHHIFSSEDVLKKHLEQFPATFNCDMCQKVFHTKDKLVHHIDKMKCRKEHTCLQCDEEFPTVSSLEEHVSLHCSNKNTSCSECGKTFESPKKLYHHRRYHGPKTHVCFECGKAFQRAHCLKKHRETVHMKIRKHVCQYCTKCYAYQSDLNRHLRIHSGASPFQCPICGQKAVYANNLRKHIRKIHGVSIPSEFLQSAASAVDSKLLLGPDLSSESALNEDEGGKLRFPTKYDADSDQYISSDSSDGESVLADDSEPSVKHETAEDSQVSSKSVLEPAEDAKEKLLLHIEKMKFKKEHTCLHCHEEFPTVSSLDQHVSSPCSKINLSCSECSKTFDTPYKLCRHQRSHKPKTHLCSDCGKAFQRAHCLKKHCETVHMKIRKYNCPYCTKCYAYRSDLTRHVRIHSGASPFQCTICGKKAVYANNLRKHIRRIHGFDTPAENLPSAASGPDTVHGQGPDQSSESAFNDNRSKDFLSEFDADSDEYISSDSCDSESDPVDYSEQSVECETADNTQVSPRESSLKPSENSLKTSAEILSSKNVHGKMPASAEVLHYSD